MNKIIFIFCVSLVCQVNIFGQSHKLSIVMNYLSGVKERSEYRISMILQQNDIVISAINASEITKLSEKKLELLNNNKRSFDLYTLLRSEVDQLIVGIESDLFISNKQLKKSDMTDKYDTELTKIATDESSLNISYNENFNGNGKSGTDFLTSIVSPSSITDIAKSIVDVVNGNRDYRAKQIQSFNTMLDGVRMSSIQDIQSGSSVTKKPAPKADAKATDN